MTSTEGSSKDSPSTHHHGSTAVLTLGALGVVFGDIGTSPLYAVNEVFSSQHAVETSTANILGCISFVFWALTLVVAIKYVALVLRAENDGEGGVFALYGLLHQNKKKSIKWLLWLLILAAGLLFGDGVITPAISVLSAVEGLKLASPELQPYIVPITVGILTGLFGIQYKGTAKVGAVFGPIILCWFLAIAYFGIRSTTLHPEILGALNPVHAVKFLVITPVHTSLLVLGGVMLAVTGGEALYADMGHFGRKPIRISWFGVVYPTVVLNYLGQGAYLLSGEPIHAGNLFFSLIPHSMLMIMVFIATAATIIASQALISGAFSLAAQATALGLFPRLKIVHTHHHHVGQIYSPFINWSLYLGCISLVIKFTSSTALASAYGLAEAGVMISTSLAMVAIAQVYWRWLPAKAWGVFGIFIALDALFLTANSLKFLDGGYIPLTIGLVLVAVMQTWKWGRKATFSAYSGTQTMTMKELVALKEASEHFLERNVILLVPKPIYSLEENTPALLQILWNRHGILPRNLVFVEIVHRKTPYVHDERCQVRLFQKSPEHGSIVSVTIAFGFMEDMNVERVLTSLASHDEIELSSHPSHWSVVGSQENFLPSRKTTLFGKMRLALFSVLRKLSRPGYYYYGFGDEVHLSLEILPVKI